jgi:hypothetical protein
MWRTLYDILLLTTIAVGALQIGRIATTFEKFLKLALENRSVPRNGGKNAPE